MKDYSEALDLEIAEANSRINKWKDLLEDEERMEKTGSSYKETRSLIEYFTGINDGLIKAKFLLRKRDE